MTRVNEFEDMSTVMGKNGRVKAGSRWGGAETIY